LRRRSVAWQGIALKLPPHAALVVSLGLLITFAAAASFGIYGAQYSRIAAQQVQEQDALSRHYEDARHALATEQSLQRQYRLEALPTIRDQFFATSMIFEDALHAISTSGGSDDRSLVKVLLVEHNLYVTRSSDVFSAMDLGHPNEADRIEEGLDPLAANIELLLNNATNRRVQAASQTLAAISGREQTLAWAMPVVFGVGILLTSALLILLEANRQARNAKSIFLAKMSHELRTPLNSILGFSQLMENGVAGSLNERQRRYIANIQASGSQLLAVINDILDLSKVEAGRMQLTLEAVSVTALINEAVKEVDPLLQLRGQHLDVVAESDGYVWTDRRRMLQVLLNGLSNALKFSDVGGRIRVVTHAVGDMIEVKIEDSGRGIPRDKLKRVFDEYAQVDHRRVGEYEGSGLGLPLSRGLIELMGGRLVLESVEGKGTRFRVLVPRAVDQGSNGRAEAAVADDRYEPDESKSHKEAPSHA
jgi:signal transduction histidine kinase